MSPTAAELLAAYDAQLRTAAEVATAGSVQRLGPVWLATFAGGRAFVTYRDLGAAAGDLDAAAVRALVARVAERLVAEPAITHAEWKTRGHDHAPGLDAALREHGFVPEEVESVMLGELTGLAALDAGSARPDDVVVRRVDAEAEVRAVARMQAVVFGRSGTDGHVDDLLRRLAGGSTELWAAFAGDVPVSAGRIDPVPGTECAGIWGGSTLASWRGRGLYRAVTAARARSALGRGLRLAHSDSTAYSRPILERAGLRAVTTTTPYQWTRPGTG